MSQYYDRRYEILVDGKPFISATDGPMFRCAFDVSINPSDTNSTADIRIYNLNDNSTGKVLKRQRTITLRAGYVEPLTLFSPGRLSTLFRSGKARASSPGYFARRHNSPPTVARSAHHSAPVSR